MKYISEPKVGVAADFSLKHAAITGNETSWLSDRYLSGLTHKMNYYELFSFDIFDTLLFRRCERPVDVFAAVWETTLRHYPDLKLTPAEYLELRREAERKSTKKNNPRHNFDLIFDEMDFEPELINFLKSTEIETEKKMVYLNNSVYSLIRDLHGQGRKIMLVSDMYHSENTIRELLSCAGFQTDLVSNIFVSSEYSCRKGNGRLFEKALNCYSGIDRKRVIHIGDNPAGDFSGAKAAGMDALLYGEFAENEVNSKAAKLNQICENIKRCGFKRIAVFTAGNYGRLFLRTAWKNGMQVSCFLDNNPEIRGKRVDGIEVCAPGAVSCDCIVVATTYANEIRTQLESIYTGVNEKPEIFYFDGEDIL